MRYLWFVFILFLSACISSKEYILQKKPFIADFSENNSQEWYAENHTFENNLAHFSEQNIHWKNGMIVLELNQQHKAEKDYTGAEMRTRKRFKYGTFEADIKASDALGCITAFFLYKPGGGKNTEIDAEISGKYPEQLTTNHWVDERSNGEDIPLGFDSTKDFHTYTILWEPGQIIWKVDGKIIRKTTEAVPQEAMQVVFNLWASKSENWAGPINKRKLPTFAYLKSFRYYPH